MLLAEHAVNLFENPRADKKFNCQRCKAGAGHKCLVLMFFGS